MDSYMLVCRSPWLSQTYCAVVDVAWSLWRTRDIGHPDEEQEKHQLHSEPQHSSDCNSYKKLATVGYTFSSYSTFYVTALSCRPKIFIATLFGATEVFLAHTGAIQIRLLFFLLLLCSLLYFYIMELKH